MLGFLDTKVTLRHLLVLGVLVAVPAMGAGALAGGSALNSLQPAGSVRMASTSSTVSVDITGDQVKRVLHVSFNVPKGKKADVQASFSASVHHLTGGAGFAYCFGTFTIDHAPPDAAFKPGIQQLLGGSQSTEPDAVSSGMVGYRNGIGSGTHTVNVYITSAYSGCELQERALNVLVNLH